MAEIDVGDVVRLRSGGPLMTVTSIKPDQISVAWFPNNEMTPHHNHFPLETLVVIPSEKPSLRPPKEPPAEPVVEPMRNTPRGAAVEFSGAERVPSVSARVKASDKRRRAL